MAFKKFTGNLLYNKILYFSLLLRVLPVVLARVEVLGQGLGLGKSLQGPAPDLDKTYQVLVSSYRDQARTLQVAASTY